MPIAVPEPPENRYDPSQIRDPSGIPVQSGGGDNENKLHLAVLALGVTMTAAAFALEGQTAVFDKYLAK